MFKAQEVLKKIPVFPLKKLNELIKDIPPKREKKMNKKSKFDKDRE